MGEARVTEVITSACDVGFIEKDRWYVRRTPCASHNKVVYVYITSLSGRWRILLRVNKALQHSRYVVVIRQSDARVLQLHDGQSVYLLTKHHIIKKNNGSLGTKKTKFIRTHSYSSKLKFIEHGISLQLLIQFKNCKKTSSMG